MTSEGIFLKKVDKKMYRRLKSAAAEKGVPVYQLLNDAIAMYVASVRAEGGGSEALSQREIDSAAYAVVEADTSLNGKWVGMANGKLLVTADTREEVLKSMRREYLARPFPSGIVAKVGEPREAEVWDAGSLAMHDVATEMDANNAAYEGAKERLLREHKGEYVVFCDGSFQGGAGSLDGAAALIRRTGRPKGLVAKVGEEIPKGGDWLWSSLELFAA